MSVMMTKSIQKNLIDYMKQCKLEDKVIAKIMAFLKNEDLWQKKTYQQLFDYIDDLYLCDCCGNVEHEEHLTATDGMINGGIGIICPSCLNDGF
ncbi:hypothetical protein [PinkBerry-associated phage LS06-2018-MD08]|nr:hypothetical protein [PinkBerry-associated phage LS06-2018-MD08]